jgi:hypothetical protein
VLMSDEQKQVWDADELQRVLAAHHAEFDEKHKLLMARLEKPLPTWERSALSKQIDANLKALQEHVRKLPRRDSITN